jgi:hypothetical protein
MRRRLSDPIPQGIDDATGFKVEHASLKMQWDGAMVVNPDKRNPQDLVRVRADTTIIPNPRPEPDDVFLATNILLEDGVTPMIGEDGRAIMTEGPLNGEGL